MGRRWMCAAVLLSVLLLLVVPVQADDYEELRQEMQESFLTEEMLDISQYGLTLTQVQEVYDELYHSGQLPWYADEDCSYVYGENQTIAKFRPKVLNEKVYDRELYEQKLAELMAATCLPGMSDWQKAISVHDYIVLHTIYDEELEKNTGYDSLIGGTTVCYGYSMLYMDVMNRQGIPCQIVITDDASERYGHAWNVVQLDGQWYHVDPTWADPVPDVYGYVSHAFFLKTDAEYKNDLQPHNYSWKALVPVSKSPYTQDGFIESIESALCFVDANTVIFRREKDDKNLVISGDLATQKETVLYEFESQELDLGDGMYLYPTCGLCLWNGRVYFNQEDRVLSMLPDGSDLQEVYTYDIQDKYLIGCMVDAGVLYLALGDQELQIERVEVPLEEVDYHTHSYQKKTVFATCQADGYHEMACQCGVSYYHTVIPKLDHRMQTQVEKAPTQQEAGITRHSCFICGYEAYEYPPALPAPERAEEQAERNLWLPVGIGGLILIAAALIVLCRKKRRVQSA